MGSSHDDSGRRRADAERLTAIGRFLRRTRFDELPQLYNILVGDMSFVGPRPLLPIDQPSGFTGRTLVRPGLTGWAQIMGGRNVGPEDKVALDFWYIRNASLALDLQIMLKTVPMLIRGEQVNSVSIDNAWSELRSCSMFGADLRPRSIGSIRGDMRSSEMQV
jgi:lipopolysaccharide/colanic/teichoic acid biosynthesis glycosyltransferase